MAFRLGSSTRLDERCFAMQQFKVMPLSLVMLSIYPKMYPIHELSDEVSRCYLSYLFGEYLFKYV